MAEMASHLTGLEARLAEFEKRLAEQNSSLLSKLSEFEGQLMTTMTAKDGELENRLKRAVSDQQQLLDGIRNVHSQADGRLAQLESGQAQLVGEMGRLDGEIKKGPQGGIHHQNNPQDKPLMPI